MGRQGKRRRFRGTLAKPGPIGTIRRSLMPFRIGLRTKKSTTVTNGMRRLSLNVCISSSWIPNLMTRSPMRTSSFETRRSESEQLVTGYVMHFCKERYILLISVLRSLQTIARSPLRSSKMIEAYASYLAQMSRGWSRSSLPGACQTQRKIVSSVVPLGAVTKQVLWIFSRHFDLILTPFIIRQTSSSRSSTMSQVADSTGLEKWQLLPDQTAWLLSQIDLTSLDLQIKKYTAEIF